MQPRRATLITALIASVAVLAAALLGFVSAAAAPSTVTASFMGTITNAMTVNDGTTNGTLPAGTAYHGTIVYDSAQTPAPVAFLGGTRSVYTYTSLSLTIGTSTVSMGPGTIDVFDNLTTGVSWPKGDSMYANFTQGQTNTTGLPPSGHLAGLSFNWIGLALLDPTGHAVTNGALPSDPASSLFTNRFTEFNYGTQGVPLGTGNTSTIQTLSTIQTSGSPTTTTTTTAPATTTTTTVATTVATTAPTTAAPTTAIPATKPATTATPVAAQPTFTG